MNVLVDTSIWSLALRRRQPSADDPFVAEFFNRCRSQGVQGSNTDFLICAVAERYDLAIFTTDNDFLHFAQHIPISLYTPSRS